MLIGILRFLLIVLLVNWLLIYVRRFVMCLIKAAIILVLRCGYAAVFMMSSGSYFLRIVLEGPRTFISLIWLRVVLVVLSLILLLVLDVQVIAEMLERLIAWLFNISFGLFVSDWLLIGVLNGSVLSCRFIGVLVGSVLSCGLVGVLDGSVLSWVVKSALNICQLSWEVICVLSGGSEISWLVG